MTFGGSAVNRSLASASKRVRKLYPDREPGNEQMASGPALRKRIRRRENDAFATHPCRIFAQRITEVRPAKNLFQQGTGNRKVVCTEDDDHAPSLVSIRELVPQTDGGIRQDLVDRLSFRKL